MDLRIGTRGVITDEPSIGRTIGATYSNSHFCVNATSRSPGAISNAPMFCKTQRTRWESTDYLRLDNPKTARRKME